MTNAAGMLAGDQAGIVCEGDPHEIADAIFKTVAESDELRFHGGERQQSGH